MNDSVEILPLLPSSSSLASQHLSNKAVSSKPFLRFRRPETKREIYCPGRARLNGGREICLQQSLTFFSSCLQMNEFFFSAAFIIVGILCK